MYTINKEIQSKLTPADGLKMLREGNQRFLNNKKLDRNLLQQVHETAAGQYPFAVVLSCIDSRTSSELIFDLGLGDIFSVRIAGNVLNDDILGSMEFACAVAGAKVILVLGHTRCGAVKGACDKVKLGTLTKLLRKIKPAVKQTPRPGKSSGDVFLYANLVAESNVRLVMNEIKEKSEILRNLVEEGKIAIAGGMYDVETGKVTFF